MATELVAWFKPRDYLHFDSPIGFRRASSIVQNADKVASHAFYPLISYSIGSTKVTSDPATSKLVRRTKERPIAYAAHLDSHIYSYYAYQLSKKYEEKLRTHFLSEHVLAFRSLGLSNINFAGNAFNEIRRRAPCAAVALDISGFFDNLDHKYLKKCWGDLIGSTVLPADHFAVFRSLTAYSTVDRDAVYEALGISPHNPKNGRHRICSPTDYRMKVRAAGLVKSNPAMFGIPQGSPISALISNIYMFESDLRIRDLVGSVDGAYYRYCDDMLLLVPTRHQKAVAGEVVKIIEDVKLKINTKKTELRTFRKRGRGVIADKPIQYLGFTFDGERVLIRSAALSRYSERMKRGVRLAKATMKARNESKAERGAAPKELYTRKLMERYSHLGKRNFIRYGHRAADILGSEAIRIQLKPLWNRLLDQIKS